MSRLPILTYHALDDSGSVISTKPAWFAETLAALHREGFTCVDLEDWAARGRPPVARGFALAFDDGLASIRLASDGLARYGYTATAFLVTGRMGRDNACHGQPPGIPVSKLLDWPDLETLRASGFRFGAHTQTHPRLGLCDRDRLIGEVTGSALDIEAHMGQPCRLFAYPYGDAPAAATDLVAAHFAAGFGTRLGYASSRESAARLSRVDAYYLRGPRALRALLDGRWETELHVRRAARALRRGFAVA